MRKHFLTHSELPWLELYFFDQLSQFELIRSYFVFVVDDLSIFIDIQFILQLFYALLPFLLLANQS